MKLVRFTIESQHVRGVTDTACLTEGDDVLDTLREAIWSAVHLDIHVTIGDVTMPAAMWEDPDHWAEDWAAKLEIDLDDAPDAVAGILAQATTEDDWESRRPPSPTSTNETQ